MKRSRLLMAAVTAAVIAGGVWYARRDSGEIVYRRARADRGEVTEVVTATGTLNAVTTVQVGSQVSGRVSRLDADFNTPVTEGQALAMIDPTPFEAQIAQAEANLMKARAASFRTSAAVEVARSNVRITEADVRTAEANLKKAEVSAANTARNWDRTRELGRKNLVSASEVDLAQTDLGRARAEVMAAAAQLASVKAKVGAGESQIKQAIAEVAANRGEVALNEAAVGLARTNLGFTRIVSPIRGIVISRNIDVGQTVAASFQAPILFLIADDLTRMQIIANVDEADIGRTREGQEVSFTVDAYPQRRFRGTVTQIRLAPIVQQNVVTYHVVVAVENAKMLLKPGMTSNASLVVARREDVLRVPNAALAFQPPGADAEPAPAGAGATPASTAADAPEEPRGLVRSARAQEGGGTGRSAPDAGRSTESAEASTSPAPDGRPREGRRRGGRRRGRAGSSDGSDVSDGPKSGRVWVFAAGAKQPSPVALVIGTTDGSFTEVVSGDLAEGAELAIGIVKDPSAEPKPTPSLTGGGRRGGGGGGGGGIRLRL